MGMTKAAFVLAACLIGMGALSGAQAAGDAERGEKVFRQCAACHSLDKGVNRVGPSLYGVIGRKAGTAPGFTRYSAAMKKADVVWNEETLDKYLAAPKEFVPGNSMAFPGLKKEQDREDVIALLKEKSE